MQPRVGQLYRWYVFVQRAGVGEVKNTPRASHLPPANNVAGALMVGNSSIVYVWGFGEGTIWVNASGGIEEGGGPRL